MHIPVNFRQFDIRQDGPGNIINNPNTNTNSTDNSPDKNHASDNDNSSRNNIIIIVGALFLRFPAVTNASFPLIAVRRLHHFRRGIRLNDLFRLTYPPSHELSPEIFAWKIPKGQME